MRKKWYRRTTVWLTIWSTGLLTYIVIANLSSPFLISLAPILGAVILTYVGGDKAVDYKHGPDHEPERKEQ